MFDFSILKKSGVSQGELARLMQVTPATVSYWVCKKKAIRKSKHERLTNLLNAMQQAFDAGELPVKEGTNREERRKALVAVLSKYLTPVTT